MYQTALIKLSYLKFLCPLILQTLSCLNSIAASLVRFAKLLSLIAVIFSLSKYLAGEMPTTFNPEFANGSVMDIGYYCVGSAVELFGEPLSVKAHAQLLDTGVDGSGSVISSYEDLVVLQHSKTSDLSTE